MDAGDIRISVITVTYDSAATIEDTLSSVAVQTYPAYEYIIVDGKSEDDTLPIVEKWREKIEGRGTKLIVISEPDDGMYDAMNKGIRTASGDIVGIINSDDWYEPDALETVAGTYKAEPFDLFWADVRMHLPDGRTFIKHSRDRKYQTSRDWNHPTTFITKETYNGSQYRNDTIHDDYDLILRLRKAGVKTKVVNKVLANFRMNGVSHKRSLSGAVSRIKLKYGIYRQNGYSRFYIFEPVIVELGKLIIG